jgi:hypothetical protein
MLVAVAGAIDVDWNGSWGLNTIVGLFCGMAAVRSTAATATAAAGATATAAAGATATAAAGATATAAVACLVVSNGCHVIAADLALVNAAATTAACC